MKNIFFLFLLLILFRQSLAQVSDGFPGTYGWYALDKGINGEVFSVAYYNGNVYAGGNFDTAGGVPANNIAVWNGSNWQPLLNGVNNDVEVMIVYNNELIVGGKFSNASNVPNTNRIAKWNGNTWSSLDNGITGGNVSSLFIYNNELIVGGNFNSVGSNIQKWNGSSWSQLGTGVNNQVFAMTVYNNDLIVGGKFNNAGGIPVSRIAKWNGSTWSALSNSDFAQDIFALTVYNDSLIAGGNFHNISGANTEYIARYNGTSWEALGHGTQDKVYALSVFDDELIVAGKFNFVYKVSNDSIYINRIAKWNGSGWISLTTGMNEQVYSIASDNTSLVVGGGFTTAGGRFINKIALWKLEETSSIAGVVKYNTNGLHVNGGYVKAIRMDWYTREVLLLDSVQINPTDGSYSLNYVRRDTVDVIAFPNDIIENDFVPTYYPSTIYWENALTINLTQNTTNIDILVFTAENTAVRNLGSIGDKVILNYLPPGIVNGSGLLFKSNAIIYAIKNGNEFKNFSISNRFEEYNITSLSPGNYKIIANRLGYTSDSTLVYLSSGVNLDTIDFVLEISNGLITNSQISSNIPEDFVLYQNYPNPFNPTTSIRFDLSKLSNVKITLYDVLGRELTGLIEKDLNAGSYVVNWNASNYPSGVYFYKLETEDFFDVKRMVLIK
ncbi:MAG: T9SS type A sorting domain-containing protein [Ignavibacteria bacterium]|nr:T9SS type A sorting domain-containing protein [Ignavibacteria bacterium]